MFLAWSPVAVYAALIFFASSLSNPLPDFEGLQRRHLDKLLHAGEYAVLGFLLARAMGKTFHFRSPVRLAASVAVVGLLYAFSDELHQSSVPLRTACLADGLADSAGIAFGLAGAFLAKVRPLPFFLRFLNLPI